MATTKPSKDSVRSWLHKRLEQRSPPPTPEQIRRELGWNMIPSNTQR